MLVGARDLAKGEAAAAELKKDGVDARAVKLDVDNSADYEAVAKMIEKDYGRLDILVNNAGIMIDGRKGNETIEDLAGCFAEDVRHEFLCCGGVDAGVAAAAEEESGRADCEPVEHSRFA